MSKLPAILAVTGPTASGKSAAALKVAKKLNAEIINADSVQFYKGFCIGASQPSVADKQECVHHLYEVLDPSKRTDIGEYLELVDPVIAQLIAKDRVPLVVGGSGLYLRTLFHGLASIPDIPEEILQRWQSELQQLLESSESVEVYHKGVEDLLRTSDVRAYEILHPSDTQRIIRALAVISHTGRSIFEYQQEHAQGQKRYSGLVVYVEPEREELYERINIRVEQMWEQGLLEEVRKLYQTYGPDVHALGSIGYRHVCKFIEGDWSKVRAIELMQRDTRRFAKRQMTWWRNQPQKLGWKMHDFVDGKLEIEEMCRNYLELRVLSESGANREVAFFGCRSLE